MKYTSRINNFLECINYLNEVQFFFSVICIRKIGLKYKSTKLSRFLNIFWVVSSVLLMYGGIAIKLSVPQFSQRLRDMSPILLLVAFLEFSLACTTSLVTCVSMMAYRTDHIDLINQFESMDQVLKREFHCQMNYEKLVKKNILVASIFIVYYCIACVCSIIQLVEGDYVLMMIIALCYMYLTMGPHASGYSHVNYAEVIKNRFRLVNKLLTAEYLIAKFPGHDERNSKVFILFQMYKDLYKRIENVNYIFGPYLVTSLLHDFFQIISQLFIVLAIDHGDNGQAFIYICFIIPPVYKMIATPRYTSAAINEVSLSIVFCPTCKKNYY